MRHHNHNRKFGRVRKVRKALMRSLAEALIERENIKTTEAKAKELRPYAEKLITSAKKGNVAAHRLLISKVGVKTAKKLISELGPKYKDRKGGYVRVTKIGTRVSDQAPMAIIELV